MDFEFMPHFDHQKKKKNQNSHDRKKKCNVMQCLHPVQVTIYF